MDNHRGKKNLVLSQWGDEYLLSEENVNPHYVASCYQSYSERTRENLVNIFIEILELYGSIFLSHVTIWLVY